MNTRQVEQLTRQRTAEIAAASQARSGARRQHGAAESRAVTQHAATGGLRTQTGWAIVAIGLRIAESGSH